MALALLHVIVLYILHYNVLSITILYFSMIMPQVTHGKDMSIGKISLYIPVACAVYTYTGGKTHLHFIWKVCSSEAEDEKMKKNISVRDSLKMTFPTYSTRAMRQEFVQCFGRFTHDTPAVLREMYRRLTGDSSSSANATEAEVDERVSQLLDSEDPNLIWDLRVNN